MKYDTAKHEQARRDLSYVPAAADLIHLDPAERDLLDQALATASVAAGTIQSLLAKALYARVEGRK